MYCNSFYIIQNFMIPTILCKLYYMDLPSLYEYCIINDYYIMQIILYGPAIII